MSIRELFDRSIIAILLLSIVLNLAGIWLPDWWHPDEKTQRVVDMLLAKSLIPPNLAYGSFHYYTLMVFVLPAGAFANFFVSDPEAQRAIVMVAGRLLSVLMGTGCVALTFLIGVTLFDRRVGLVAALVTALSVGMVILAQIATTSIPAVFWALLSVWMAARFLASPRAHHLVLAGLFAGLAAATKYTAGVFVLAAVTAFLLSSERKRWSWMLLCAATAAVTFLITNPALFLSHCYFLEGFLRENRFNQLRDADGPLAFLPLIRDLSYGVGWGAFLAIAGGLVYATVLVIRGPHRQAMILLLCPILAYYLLVGSHHVSEIRYAVPIVPLLLVIGAKFLVDMMASRRVSIAVAGRFLFAVAVIVAAMSVASVFVEFAHDTRLLARDWILENAPPGSSIETTFFGIAPPRLPRSVYQVTERIYLEEQPGQELEVVSGVGSHTLETDPVYQRMTTRLAQYFDVAEAIGLCDGNRPYYRGWFDVKEDQFKEQNADAGATSADLEARAPDYLIRGRVTVAPFHPAPLFFDPVGGQTAYREVKRFPYTPPPWLDSHVLSDNPIPDIVIFQRVPTTS